MADDHMSLGHMLVPDNMSCLLYTKVFLYMYGICQEHSNLPHDHLDSVHSQMHSATR